MKRALTLALALVLALCAAYPAHAVETQTAREAYAQTADYLIALGDPVAGSIGGEWMVLGLARGGYAVAESYYSSVVAYVSDNIDENGRLHEKKSTLNCRFIVALTALGKDVTDVGGHDLLCGLNELDYLKKVGVTGLIWALIAFDCGNYPTPAGVERDALVQSILDYRTSDGGWANSGDRSDPDVTAMAMQALAPYREQSEVAAALDTAVTLLSQMQDDTGNFPSQYGSSSESIAQIIVALCTLGIDPNTDARFVKGGISAVDALLSYHAEDGGFRHILSGKTDGMATEQGFYALSAWFRLLDGKTALYDMTDVTASAPISPTDPTVPEPSAPEEPTPAIAPARIGLYALLLACAVAAAACLLLRRRLGKRRCANLLLAIALLLIAGLGALYVFGRGASEQPALGSEYRITPIPNDRLVTSDDPQSLCTITIRCDTVLQNLSLADEAKLPYIPSDGVILPTVTVEFSPGETVFDVLRRVCEAADIPLEYSWTPLYDSYYLEGICHLYEFDCGAESGWMYCVNDRFPNYGSSACEVQPGDSISWLYSCVGLGADLGAQMTEG